MRVTGSALKTLRERLREAEEFVQRVTQLGKRNVLSRWFSSGDNLKELTDIGRRILEAQQPLQMALNQSVREVQLMSAAVLHLCKTRVQCGFRCCQLSTELLFGKTQILLHAIICCFILPLHHTDSFNR